MVRGLGTVGGRDARKERTKTMQANCPHAAGGAMMAGIRAPMPLSW